MILRGLEKGTRTVMMIENVRTVSVEESLLRKEQQVLKLPSAELGRENKYAKGNWMC